MDSTSPLDGSSSGDGISLFLGERRGCCDEEDVKACDIFKVPILMLMDGDIGGVGSRWEGFWELSERYVLFIPLEHVPGPCCTDSPTLSEIRPLGQRRGVVAQESEKNLGLSQNDPGSSVNGERS